MDTEAKMSNAIMACDVLLELSPGFDNDSQGQRRHMCDGPPSVSFVYCCPAHGFIDVVGTSHSDLVIDIQLSELPMISVLAC